MARIPHIQVDAFPLVDDHFSGVGHATLGIIQGFDELAGEGKLTYSLITPRRWTHRIQKYNLMNYKRVIGNPVPNKIIRGFMKYRWPIPFDLILGRGYYYFPSFLAWPTWFSKSSVVIHDATYLAVPECVDRGNREYLSQVVPFSLRNSQNVITVSEFSKKEIIKYYGVKPSDVFVAYNAIDRRHFYKRSEAEIFKVKCKYDIFQDNYFLSVGNVEPRKNYVRLIDAYTSLPRAVTDKYALVIVGAGGWNNKDILARIQKAKEDGYRIINPKQFVLDKDLPALYSGATLYLFSPIYEGFGMSPLEAYACGTQVVSSNATSIPEAAGDAAVYFDPYDIKDIRSKILSTLKSVEKNPDFMKEEMGHRLEGLNWRDSAEITAAALTGYPVSYFKKGNK